jgi:FkbH-like protein
VSGTGGHRLRWERERLGAGRGALVEELAAATDRTIRIDVLSQTTWRPIAPFLRGELACEGIAAELSFSEYEQLEAALAVGGGRVEAAILALDDPERLDGLLDPAAPFDRGRVDRLVASVRERCEILAARARTVAVVWPAVDTREAFPLARVAAAAGDDLASRDAALRAEVRAAVRAVPGAIFVDLAEVLARIGSERARDDRLWEIGRIAWSESGFAEIAAALLPALLATAGVGIKAAVVDLDHTLWSGVVGERGARGVEVDAPRRELQRELRRWKEAGILLAVASKNSPEDARGPFAEHPGMVLAWEDFSAHEAHWDPKPQSLRRIIERFGIGPDAVLFIDDNPREREAVRAGVPGVRVLELAEDPAQWPRQLRTLPWPLFASSSDEDRRRGELQSQRDERRAALEGAEDPAEHLASLGIELEIRFDAEETIERVAKMHAKTNQFHLDPIRLSEAEIRAWGSAPGRSVVAARYRDRFGDAGIIGAALVERRETEVWVETFLLSCRVIGLGVERALLAEILRLAGEGRETVRLPYRGTDRNEPARRFLEELAGGPPAEGGIRLPRAQWPEVPAWIGITETVTGGAA